MVRVAVMDNRFAERVIARHGGFELVEDADDADVVVVDPAGEGLALCSLLSARGVPVIVFAPDADEVVLLGAGVAGAAAVVKDRSGLLAAIRGLPVAA